MRGSGSFCSVAGCNNSSRKKKKENLTDLSFHSFPKNVETKQLWVMKCCRQDKFNPDTGYVCSNHFEENDFVVDLKAKMLEYQPRRRLLNKNAVPSKNLPQLPKESLSGTQRKERYCQKEIREDRRSIVESVLLNNSSTITDNHFEEGLNENLNANLVDSVPSFIHHNENEERIALLKQNEILQKTVARSETLYKKMFQRKTATNKRLKTEIKKLKLELKQTKKRKIRSNAVEKVFTSTQLRSMAGEVRKPHWNNNEISQAATLRCLGQRAYNFVRNDMKIPLPGLSTLKRWAQKFDIRSGILDDVIKMMDMYAKSKDLDEFQRTTVLMFDEMSVKETLEYDQLHDEIIGPHKQMQVVMARGLTCKWMQPIFVDFDQKITKDLLFELITRLHQIGYRVIACASDCGGSNVGLMRALGIDYTKPYFRHPNLEKNIFYYPDAPHLLKLIRNWFLDTGFILAGKKISKACVQSLIRLVPDSDELNVCYKLRDDHTDCQKTERQKVRLATELMSHRTSSSLQRYKEQICEDLKCDPSDIDETANFIEMVDQWFTLMNTRYVPSEHMVLPPSQQPFGKNLTEQMKVLKKFSDVVQNMRCVGKKSLQLFQKSVLLSINALSKMLEENKEFRYFLTSRLNQDPLESIFGHIRIRGGGDDTPTPLHALHRLKMLIIGKSPGIISRFSNIHRGPSQMSQEKTAEGETRDIYITAAIVDEFSSDNKNEDGSNENGINEDGKSTRDDGADENSSTSKDNSIEENINVENELKKIEFSKAADDGIEYLAGWISKKFKKEHPEWGVYTKDLQNKDDHNLYSKPTTWTTQFSYGGLRFPSKELLKTVNRLERLFLKFIPQGVPKGRNVVKRYTNKLIKHMPEDEFSKIIKIFIKQRIFIRMKYDNRCSDKSNLKKKTRRKKMKNIKKTFKNVA